VRFARSISFATLPGRWPALHYIDASSDVGEDNATGGHDSSRRAVDTTLPRRSSTRACVAPTRLALRKLGEIWPPSTRQARTSSFTTRTRRHEECDRGPVDLLLPAVTRVGDIGYNYFSGATGIYQGRYGGPERARRALLQYAIAAPAILHRRPPGHRVPRTRSPRRSIVAWVGRDLDPFGTSDFLELSTCRRSHGTATSTRTTCPGDYLWNDLPEIRECRGDDRPGELNSPYPGGDVVVISVMENTQHERLNLPGAPARARTVDRSLPHGALAVVVEGRGDRGG